MTKFSEKYRSNLLEEIQQQHFDLIIIGGGITGAGILLDAQDRGLKCCLLEMQDFAEGTSSRSTKLIHGGLRYLNQWNFQLVKETGRERTIVQHIARHLTYPKKVIVPAIKDGNFSKLQLNIALWVYEILAKVPKTFLHNRFSKNDLLHLFPFIKSDNLLGGIEYTEFQSNDARLTLENIKTGISLGGTAINLTKVISINEEHNIAVGVTAQDLIANTTFDIKGKCIINATGPWSDQFSSHQKKHRIAPSKGVHLVFPNQKFPITKALYFDTPDKRMIFAIPDENCTYIGTTDNFYKNKLDQLLITSEDVTYLINSVNSAFPSLNLSSKDIISGWVGVRPLINEEGKKPSELSRKHEIFTEGNGLLTIAGGKLTGYRKMAEKIIDQAIIKNFKNDQLTLCNTKSITLIGSNFKNDENYNNKKHQFISHATQNGWSKEECKWVYKLYGSESPKIIDIKGTLKSTLPDYLLKSLLYSIDNEFVSSPSDFLIRRTNLCYFHPKTTLKFKYEISKIIYEELGYTDKQKDFFNNKLSEDLNKAYNFL